MFCIVFCEYPRLVLKPITVIAGLALSFFKKKSAVGEGGSQKWSGSEILTILEWNYCKDVLV